VALTRQRRSPNGSALTPNTRDAIREAALDLFYRQGYHGTSVRQIAGATGISVSTLFHHFDSKINILELIVKDAMRELIAETDARVEAAGEGPVEQLDGAVRALIAIATSHPRESTVGNSELRSLTPRLRRSIVDLRDRHQLSFEAAIESGVKGGVFTVSHVKETSRAIIAMCASVSSWFRTSGRLSAEQVSDVYSELALRMVRSPVLTKRS
jgi:AcrR family transcriptional regulator